MLTGGVRVDEKRSFSLFLGQGDTYVDYAPADLYSIRTGIRCYKNLHLFLGPTIATDCLGLHLGIGF